MTQELKNVSFSPSIDAYNFLKKNASPEISVTDHINFFVIKRILKLLGDMDIKLWIPLLTEEEFNEQSLFTLPPRQENRPSNCPAIKQPNDRKFFAQFCKGNPSLTEGFPFEVTLDKLDSFLCSIETAISAGGTYPCDEEDVFLIFYVIHCFSGKNKEICKIFTYFLQ